jgi:hypothetical protein
MLVPLAITALPETLKRGDVKMVSTLTPLELDKKKSAVLAKLDSIVRVEKIHQQRAQRVIIAQLAQAHRLLVLLQPTIKKKGQLTRMTVILV